MKKYFEHCQTAEDAKVILKTLVGLFHPIFGTIPDQETASEVNKQYLDYSASKYNVPPAPAPAVKTETKQDGKPDGLIEAAKFANTLEGVTVEIAGSWIWVTGNTKDHWETLKANGFWYSKDKNCCYWKPADAKFRRKGKPMAYGQIQMKYNAIEAKKLF